MLLSKLLVVVTAEAQQLIATVFAGARSSCGSLHPSQWDGRLPVSCPQCSRRLKPRPRGGQQHRAAALQAPT